jgi:hypothetical protein
MIPPARLFRVIDAATAAQDPVVSVHATDADWPALRDAAAGLRAYSTARRSHVMTRSGATRYLEDPGVQSAPSPVLNFPDRRRAAV